jgi:2-succinyl-5-enolpyruvyl-6-hydroxy-3-cyclohexene-1-carboxylate synthase
VSILDERSAAFFALGHGKATGRPAVVLCTSGTAAANFLPAVIEAHESRVPLLILTADRPPELRDCHSGQTIDQLKIYGNYPNWQTEIAVPHLDLLDYLQQTITYAWERTLVSNGGAVHLNLPFRDPLWPQLQPEIAALEGQLQLSFPPTPASSSLNISNWTIPTAWRQSKGLIVAGIAQPADPNGYVQAVNQISQALGWPILAEGLSPLRHYASDRLIATYDQIARHQPLELQPEAILQLGDLPTSKALRQWLAAVRPATWIVENSVQNVNALHLPASYLRTTIEQLATQLQEKPHLNSDYLNLWLIADRQVQAAIDRTMQDLTQLCEPKIPWVLSQSLPAETLVFVANSMPIRDMEFFWRPSNQQYRILGNRGANGIDGTLSTALGAVHRQGQSGLLITGDLSLLHDTNGLLIRQQLQGSLTILVINNNGGGIFGMLPIGQFDPPFTEFFTTPQNVDLQSLCQAYQIPHVLIPSWAALQAALPNKRKPGITVWEIITNSTFDNQWRQENLSQFASGLSISRNYP